MINQFRYFFKSPLGVSSSCNIVVISNHENFLFIFEDIRHGSSVTNSSEELATDMLRKHNLDPNNCRFFETYPENNYNTFEEIDYIWVSGFLVIGKQISWKATRASWKPGDLRIKDAFFKAKEDGTKNKG
jgi:hypothetical protein